MTAASWQQVAWDEVSLEIPARWSPARVEARELAFEEDGEVALELGWRQAGAAFSFDRPLGDLRRKARRRGALFLERPLPAAPPAGVEGRGFEWREPHRTALGAILFCRECRKASLLQFPGGAGAAETEHRAARVLSSFRDHRADGRRAWRLFDAEALLPARFRLQRSRFEAGRYTLEFRARGEALTLLRWAPAAVLLEEHPLPAFAARFAGGHGGEFRPRPFGGGEAVEAVERPPAAGLPRLLARLTRRFRRIRLWHDAARNRILGVRWEARREIDDGEMEALCRGWRSHDPP